MLLKQRSIKEAEERKNEIDKIQKEIFKIRVRHNMSEDDMQSLIMLVQDLQRQQHLYRLARISTMGMVHK